MAELPGGTVTFLFTDIEGSTNLLRHLGEGYERVLSDHRNVLRQAFESSGGTVVDAQGDAFFVVFPRAADAIAAAVDGLRALEANEWPPGGKPRVRMGIHTGEPSLVEDGFIGLPVHRGARLCAAGYGGQILLSGTTRDIAEDHLPPGIRLVDLGEHKLKDFDRPESISQVTANGLESTFPPLRAASSEPGGSTPFAGHEGELAAAAQAVLRTPPPRHASAWARVMDPLHRRVDPLRRLSGIRRRRGPAHRIESPGFRLYASARIAPNEKLAGEVRSLGSSVVEGARLAADADRLLAEQDDKTLARRLRDDRESAHISDRHLRAADALAQKIAAREALVEARRVFEEETRQLEPKLDRVRDQLFDARLDAGAADDVAQAVQELQESFHQVSARLQDAYSLASSTPIQTSSVGRAPDDAHVAPLEGEGDFAAGTSVFTDHLSSEHVEKARRDAREYQSRRGDDT
jgi:class 3 adenylate cyclase